MFKYAVLMKLPEGKKPGFYAQIIKTLANKVMLFDRDKEMLIVNTEEEIPEVSQVLDHYHVEHEPMRLFLLPEGTKIPVSADEYGFTSRFENTYLYAQLTAIFRFVSVKEPDESEQSQALLQMEEHVLMKFEDGQDSFYVTQNHLRGSIEGIAKAYHCKVEFRE